MGRFTLVLPFFFVTLAQASNPAYTKDCIGTSDNGDQVEVRIAPSTSLPGDFQADVLVNGVSVYSTQYVVHTAASDKYWTSGNSDLVLAGPPTYSETRLYLHVWNADGSMTVPSFDTIAVSCE